ncbi:hypothetical protein [Undibacterium pigrum]|uniref:hypothetical protein n=1 Tax=Undibacterium pigrum TaxID=401470 RepID=UPI0011B6106E|nr:hypothetical protein [Undibacterium pigrum]
MAESSGGDLGAAYAIAQFIKDRKINTAVQGNCFSSCAVMFMAGTERRMLASKNLARTRLGFHGPHKKQTREVSTEGIPKLREWLLEATNGKFPEELLDQAMYINRAGDMMYFYYPGANRAINIRFCKEATVAYPELCETVQGHDLLSVGILTTAELLKVEDLEPQAAAPASKEAESEKK